MLIRRRRFTLLLLIGIGLVSRLYLAFTFHGNFDQDSYELVIAILQRGGNVYAETFRYNYSPLWAFTLLALSGLADLLGLSYHAVIRSALTLLAGITALFIWKLSAPRQALLYWLNPVSIMLVGYGGQFETLATLPLLMALIVPRRTWLLGTLSLLIKHLTLPFVWMLFACQEKPRRSIFWLLSTGAVFLVSFIPFAPEGIAGIVQNVFLYRGGTGWFGLALFLPTSAELVLMLIAILAVPFIVRTCMDLHSALLLSSLTFLALTPGAAQQYFILPVIFGSLSPSRWLYLFSGTVALALASTYLSLGLPDTPLWFATWLVLPAWLLSLWRKTQAARLTPHQTLQPNIR